MAEDVPADEALALRGVEALELQLEGVGLLVPGATASRPFAEGRLGRAAGAVLRQTVVIAESIPAVTTRSRKYSCMTSPLRA